MFYGMGNSTSNDGRTKIRNFYMLNKKGEKTIRVLKYCGLRSMYCYCFHLKCKFSNKNMVPKSFKLLRV